MIEDHEPITLSRIPSMSEKGAEECRYTVCAVHRTESETEDETEDETRTQSTDR